METYFFGEADNISQSSNNRIYSVYTDNYLNFNKQFNPRHTLNTSLGFRIQANTFQFDFGEAKNLPENDQYINLQSGKNEYRSIMGDIGAWNWLAAYNQITYKFKDRYILNTGLSADFSSRVGKDANTSFQISGQPFGLFYSVGAGWRISEESFLKQVQGLDNLMLRVSYGTTGNDDIGNYNSRFFYNEVRYRETSGLIPGSLSNTALKYEESRQFNAGLDLSLRGDRTSFSINYYVLTSDNMLIFSPQKSYTGISYRPLNSGSIQNKGIELIAFQRIVDNFAFKWDIVPVLSYLSNEVLSSNGEKLITSFEGGNFVTSPGNPINSFYGYQFTGVFAGTEDASDADLVNARGIPLGAGDAIYADFSGPDGNPDRVIDDYDKVVLGSPIPDFFGSITNSFKYRRWALDAVIQFTSGNEIFNYVRYMNERMVDLSNQSDIALKRWQYEGHVTDVPRALYKDPVGNSNFSSRWIEDGSYIRLKYLTLSYNVPESFLVFKNAAFYVTATNLFTFSKYLGYDPEFAYSVDPMEQGIDYGLMPHFRQLLAGIKFGL